MPKADIPMPTTIDRSHVNRQLRGKAEAHLKAGTARASSHEAIGIDALRLLHRLSSHPGYAEDALKLLHELQVHQVELDLQHEEIAATERALVEDLCRYRVLYDSAPIGYLLVDFEGRVIQANRASAELFGAGRNELQGQLVDTVLDPRHRPRLRDLLRRVVTSGSRDSCVAMAGNGEMDHRAVHFMAAIAPGREYLLLACCNCAHAE